MRSLLFFVSAVALGLMAFPLAAHDIVRRAGSSLPIATSVLVPAGSDVVFVGGILPDAADPAAPAGSAERAGDTAAQAHSVLAKIAAELEAQGFAMADVVKMDVFLVGDAQRGGAADYAGLMSAYLKYFGKEEGGLPARTTVQVAGLAVPGALVEIGVIAARAGDHPHD
jgi:enamine deaminase RidA (YjgF/YER057c/UK114 family)